jgi:hypothetical protein
MRKRKIILGWEGIKEFIETVVVMSILAIITIGVIVWAIIVYIVAQGKNGKDFIIKKFKK